MATAPKLEQFPNYSYDDPPNYYPNHPNYYDNQPNQAYGAPWTTGAPVRPVNYGQQTAGNQRSCCQKIFAMAFLLYKLWFHPIHWRILTSRDDLVDDELHVNHTPTESHLSLSSKHQILSRRTRRSANGRCWCPQKSQRTKDNIKHSTKLETIEYLDEPLTSPLLLATSSNQIEHQQVTLFK
ncbi:unnamed protein product [Adineta ricciae]|uniref:Uncharacterized protein n=1 Tax=Adineta ricciae TaxID=249248 RepID=A0A815JRZ3_ADIRI|nr:unnamed protein product [Adineta ricciae]